MLQTSLATSLPEVESRVRPRLLLLDDEDAIRVPVSRYFRNMGWSVVAAQEPEEAEALLEHRRFDLVILDLWVTRFGTEGLEVLRSLRKRDPWTPVIVMSAHVTEEVEAEARSCGADAVLRKPLPLPDVAQVAIALRDARA
jgi:DNA-binding response OmpR family regulator